MSGVGYARGRAPRWACASRERLVQAHRGARSGPLHRVRRVRTASRPGGRPPASLARHDGPTCLVCDACRGAVRPVGGLRGPDRSRLGRGNRSPRHRSRVPRHRPGQGPSHGTARPTLTTVSSPARRTSTARASVAGIAAGIVVLTALTWPTWPVGATARAAGEPLASPRAQRAGPPRGWPDDVAVPAEVRAAEEALAAAREALRRTRRGLEAELSVAPTLDLLARDDPPRPLETDLAWRPKASLSWSPLRSEALLAEARALEADADRIAAWREATLSALRAPVTLARAHDAVAAAEHDLEAALRRSADVAAEAEALAAQIASDVPGTASPSTDAPGPDARAGRGATRADAYAEVERRRAAATLDVREARIDLGVARRELRDLLARGEYKRLDPTAERRPDLPLPELPDATATRAYRARALRLAADVARSERRWRKAVMPRLGVEVGYAGSDGALAAQLELRDGRPRGRVSGALGGTPQERGWATVSALFRLGTDLPSAQAATVAAREAERRTLDDHAATWTREAEERRHDARTARARWRVAEARRATIAPDDERGRARALEAARRTWLRYLAALDKLTRLAETWPELAP